jgi:hypothetical protein
MKKSLILSLMVISLFATPVYSGNVGLAKILELALSNYGNFKENDSCGSHDKVRDFYEISLSEEKPEKKLEVEIITSIKAVPYRPNNCAFKVFHIGLFQEMAVIAAIACYDNYSNLVETQINKGFERIELEDSLVVMEKTCQIIK